MAELLTVTQLTERFPISRFTVYRLTKRNQIPFCRIGGRLLFRSSTIEKWLDSVEVLARPLGGPSTSTPVAASRAGLPNSSGRGGAA